MVIVVVVLSAECSLIMLRCASKQIVAVKSAFLCVLVVRTAGWCADNWVKVCVDDAGTVVVWCLDDMIDVMCRVVAAKVAVSKQ